MVQAAPRYRGRYTGVRDIQEAGIHEIELAFFRYLRTYFVQRNLDETLKLLAPGMTGFGTAWDERGDDGGQSQRLYARDILQAPNPVEFTINYLDCRQLSPEFGLVRAELDLRTSIFDQEFKLLNARLTALFRTYGTKDDRNEGKKWLLEHQHISLPTSAHGDTESYPVRELEERAAVLERLVAKRTRELQEAHDRMEQLAITDPLTGIHNRLKGQELLEHELSRFRRYHGPLAVILLDIDHFKRINDTLGHGIGDEVLRRIAAVLADGVRDTDLPARWGGEEFLILCPGSGIHHATELAERLRRRMEGLQFQPDIKVRGSFGVAEARSEDTGESLVARADGALYRAKHLGRNRVETE